MQSIADKYEGDPPMMIERVFGLMLENRSLDHLFAFSGIAGVPEVPSSLNFVSGTPRRHALAVLGSTPAFAVLGSTPAFLPHLPPTATRDLRGSQPLGNAAIPVGL